MYRSRPRPIWSVSLIGGAAGLLSGLTGVGGGVFLTPQLVALGWASPKQSTTLSPPLSSATRSSVSPVPALPDKDLLRRRCHPGRQRPPNNLEAPGQPSKGRRRATGALAG